MPRSKEARLCEEADADVLHDWRDRLRRVRLLAEYTHGPLVDSRQHLLGARGAIEHNEYFKRVLEQDSGEVEPSLMTASCWRLDQGRRRYRPPPIQITEARRKNEKDDPGEAFAESAGPLPPIHEYRTNRMVRRFRLGRPSPETKT
jgi:hypothetical protein